MSEEIKEILEKLNNMIIFDENLIGWQIDGNGTTISKKDFKILLDYITNLQEENKKLKELCDKYEEEHKTTFEYWKHLIKEDYKTRIDKAIEYINEMCLCSDGYCDYGDDLNPEHIIDILKGDNK